MPTKKAKHQHRQSAGQAKKITPGQKIIELMKGLRQKIHDPTLSRRDQAKAEAHISRLKQEYHLPGW
jgi:hypothetical protein